MIWRFAIWYWVLSVTVTEPLSSFAGVIKKIMKAMTAVQTVKDSLLQPKTKVKVVNEIKEKARPSIMSRLAEKKKELAEREANKKNDLKKSWNRDDR